jgi:hypothetical protein
MQLQQPEPGGCDPSAYLLARLCLAYQSLHSSSHLRYVAQKPLHIIPLLLESSEDKPPPTHLSSLHRHLEAFAGRDLLSDLGLSR